MKRSPIKLQAFLCLFCTAPLLAAAPQPVRLQPSSPWDVDYAADTCRLIRVFGEGKGETKLAFERAGGGTDMLVIGRPIETYLEKATARFVPTGAEMDEGNVVRTADGKTPAILWSDVPSLPDAVSKPLQQQYKAYFSRGVRPPAQSEAEQNTYKQQSKDFFEKTTEIAIETRHGHTVALETGSLGDAMAAFDKCDDDSLADWGVDVDLQKKIARGAWATNGTDWLSSADYPRNMLMEGKEAEVTVRLLIDATGKITKCTPISHYKEDEFKQITCNNISRRARFEPAELADGTKVPSYYVRRIVFRIAL